MKRTVILVRHGKACSHDIFEKDIDRVLIQRGVTDGYKVARRLSNQKLIPDLILTSPAARASHTALIFAREMGVTGTGIVKVVNSFYHGSWNHILSEIRSLDPGIGTVAVFAHNPSISDLTFHLTGGANSFLPTTGTAIIEYNMEKWADLGNSKAGSYSFIFPREIS